MDNLFAENQRLKEKLMHLQTKYDYNDLDRQISLAQLKEQELDKVLVMLKELYIFIENSAVILAYLLKGNAIPG